MNALSITQLSQFSGVKAHTIRIWEQRYNALVPERSEGNVRMYSGDQLRRLLNIVSLSELNYKISKLCSMSDQELQLLIKQSFQLDTAFEPNVYIPQLVKAGMAYDEIGFNKLLNIVIEKWGVVEAYQQVVYPLINKVGLLWSANMIPPAQEHFISNLVRRKLWSLSDAIALDDRNTKKWVLLLPEDEYHEIGLLMAQYLLRLKGITVIYLGSSVSVEVLNLALADVKPDAVFLFFVHNDMPESAQRYIDQVNLEHVKGNIFLSGHSKIHEQLCLNSRMFWLNNVSDLQELIKAN